MPAMLDDPTSPVVYRRSGPEPYPAASSPLLPTIIPIQTKLRDRITNVTIIPFSSLSQVPPSLVAYLCDQLNREIEAGDTYPMIDPISLSSFGPYWFANFGAVMLEGTYAGAEQVSEGGEWSKECLGSFYVKPNYPGRSSHVCNGGFLVCAAARNKGVGRLMGEAYIDWAPKLGYTYSVFNLVYETNVASCRIWDALGFKRIGRVKNCGNLRSYPDQLIDAIQYGRDLTIDSDLDLASEERFDKIKYYLKYGKYPDSADRAEKSRLRSAATQYRLVPASPSTSAGNGTSNGVVVDGEEAEKLMFKDKEVIANPDEQYRVAVRVHEQSHAGINKTTAIIAEKYHFARIKETASAAIKNCVECSKSEIGGGGGGIANASQGHVPAVRSTFAEQAAFTGSSAPSQWRHDGVAGRKFVAGTTDDEALDPRLRHAVEALPAMAGFDHNDGKQFDA